MRLHRLVMLALSVAACAGRAPPEPERPPPVAARLPPPVIPPATDLVPIESCGDTSDGFAAWLATFKNHAMEQRISPELVDRALGNLDYDGEVIELDRAQHTQKRSFEEFASSHVTPARVKRGKERIASHAELLARITARFGVPKEIVVAIWGLETDFGANQGSTRSLRALATLAYDCRRAERFRGELASALRLLQRGDLSVDTMVGAWAGELGQTQFLPSSYERFGIDFDGDGRIDLVRSVEDALGSTAHYLAEHGWRPSERYIPGSPNFDVLGEWNRSEIYRKTIVLFASKLAGPSAVRPAH